MPPGLEFYKVDLLALIAYLKEVRVFQKLCIRVPYNVMSTFSF